MYRLLLALIFILSNFSFGFDHINYYSNGKFSYIESILNIIWQVFGFCTILFSIYYVYCFIYKNKIDITCILLLSAVSLSNTIVQIAFVITCIIGILIHLYNYYTKQTISSSSSIKVIRYRAKTPKISPVNIEEKENESSALMSALNEFHVYGKIVNVHYGPLITVYEFEPEAGTKASRIIALSDDIGRSIKNSSIRIAIITGKNSIGIEVANLNKQIIDFNNLINSNEFKETQYPLPVALGEDIMGDPFIADLSSMPHLLIAGTTGSGKSVGLNGIIMSLIYKKASSQCKLVLIDPKRLEFIQYEKVPHLLYPIAFEHEKIITILKSILDEMNARYQKMSKAGVRNISQYKGNLPYIVVIIDEFADLIHTIGKELEMIIQRLSQMARAAGIHIILSTQRPSVDVITGTIKSNFPARIAYKLASKIDSRIVIGEQGAEQLLGNGDMLYLPPAGRIIRLHAPYVDTEDIKRLIKKIR